MNLNEESQSKNRRTDTLQLIDGLASPQECVYGAFADSIRPLPPVDYVEWARNNIVFDADNQFPGPYDPDKFPFYKKILRCLEPNHPSSVVVLKGSAQIGKTITAQVFVGATLETEGGGFFYVHPTVDMAATWVRTKWKTFVQNTPCLNRLFPRENKSRDSSNTLLHKDRIDGNGFLRISGANSAAGLAQQSYRRQVHDDLAKWENNEHGDPETQADERSSSWGDWSKILKISTCGIKGICRITKNYEASNQQEYHVPCPHCGHQHALTWENFKESLDVIEEFARKNPDTPIPYSDAHFTCPECGGVIEHHHKQGMIEATNCYDAWVAKNPRSKIEGFYIWGAYSPLTTWAKIAERYFLALGDPEAEKTFMTDRIGVAYEQKGEAPPWKDLKNRAASSHYAAGEIPVGAVLLTGGIDVQGDRVEWLVMGWGPDKRRYAIQHGVIDGHISEERVRKQLDALIRRKWRNAFGREIGLDMTAIDANFETNEVKDWAKRHAKVITVKGAKSYTAAPMVPIREERNNKGKTKKIQTKHWLVGVSGLKGSLYKNLEKTDPLERGYYGFPNDFDDEYFIQLTSETRKLVVNKKTNFSEYVWIKLPDKRNEILDMNNYAEVAARRIGWHNAADSDWERVRSERERPVDNQMDLLDPSIVNQAAPPPDPKKNRKSRRVRHKGI